MINLTIEIIQQSAYHQAYALQCEYLDEEPFDCFVRRAEGHGNLYLVAMHDEQVVGVCYGEPSTRAAGTLTLQGIMVNLDARLGYARVGIGSTMLRCFERLGWQQGYQTVGVGAAQDPKVERFYLKNGYKPWQLVAKNYQGEELDRVEVHDYSSVERGRSALFAQHDCREVIIIFQKTLGQTSSTDDATIGQAGFES